MPPSQDIPLKSTALEFGASQEEKYETFMSLARGELTEPQLAAWIRAHIPQ